jgi:hypothetical protein
MSFGVLFLHCHMYQPVLKSWRSVEATMLTGVLAIKSKVKTHV